MMWFLGLDLNDRVPDARTIWLFRERLTQAGAMESLFATFDAALPEQGYKLVGGQIVDASLIAGPRQGMTKEEQERPGLERVPMIVGLALQRRRHKKTQMLIGWPGIARLARPKRGRKVQVWWISQWCILAAGTLSALIVSDALSEVRQSQMRQATMATN